MTAPDATAATAAHLPNPPDILLGRERELAAIAALFADPACRLVTLHGPGGVGKTRLAIAAAAVDPTAWFVDLAPLAEPGASLPAVAAALGVSPDLAPDPLARVAARTDSALPADRAALATANLRAGIAAAAAMRDRDAMIEAVDTASLLTMPEDPERAALLAGIAAAARVRERIPAHPGIAVRLHRHHPALRAALGDDRYAELRAAGSVLSLQAGIAIAAAPPAPATARTSGASPRA